MVTFENFRNAFASVGYVTPKDVAAVFPTADKNNLTRWCQQGLLVKIRNGLYSFPEYIKNQEFTYFIANKIYDFSYVSLHSALTYHGYLPSQPGSPIDSVTQRKTQQFRNAFGKFNYQTLKPELLFGFAKHAIDGISFQMAYPEKALLDLFYLYPGLYKTEQDFRNFAIEVPMLYENFDLEKLFDYLERFDCKALTERAKLFVHIFELQ